MSQPVPRLFGCALAILTIAVSTCAAAERIASHEYVGTKNTDAQKIVGVWKIKSAEVDGENPFPPVAIALMRWSFKSDGKVEFVLGKIKEKPGEYKLSGKGELDMTEGPFGGVAAIAKIDADDQLSICFSAGGPERPKEFTGAKGKAQVLFVFTRTKAGAEMPTEAEIAKFKNELEALSEKKFHTETSNSLKMISLGMHSYHAKEKALPLHAIYSKDGKTPLLSWRVALLPYLEQNELYKEFKLDEPWNSEHNKKLIPKMPNVFQSASADRNDGKTPFQTFTGPNTVFDGAKKLTLLGFGAGTTNTLLVVEAKNAVTWTEPIDLTLPKEKGKLPELGGILKMGFLAAMADGSVRVIPFTTPPAQVRSMISPNGKE